MPFSVMAHLEEPAQKKKKIDDAPTDQVPPVVKPDDILKQLLATEQSVAAAKKSIKNRWADLKYQKQRYKHQMEYMYKLRNVIKQLPEKIAQHEKELAQAQMKLASLRYWSKGIDLADLPDELLILVAQYFEFMDRLLLRRVSKRWKYLLELPQVTAHIYIRMPSLEVDIDGEDEDYSETGRRLRAELYPGEDWRFQSSTARKLTFAGWTKARECGKSPVEENTAAYMHLLVARFPQLELVTISHIRIEYLAAFEDAFLRPQYGKLPIRLVNSFMAALPAKALAVDPDNPFNTCDASDDDECHGHGGKVVNWYVEIRDATLRRAGEYRALFDRLVWPYPEAQTKWLAHYTAQLGDLADYGQISRRYLAWFDGTSEWDTISRCPHMLCPTHRTFCSCQPHAFYKNAMDGGLRCLLAIFILRQKIRQFQPPLWKFNFTKNGVLNAEFYPEDPCETHE